MKLLTLQAYHQLRRHAQVLSRDSNGEKVLLLADGTILKLFRLKRWFSSALVYPHSLRFGRNARQLAARGVRTVSLLDTFVIPALRRTAVQYWRLPGIPLRNFLSQHRQAPETIRALGSFVAGLHQKGIYFRAIHFGNILVLPENEFALIDIDDARFHPRPLNRNKRMRNLRHFTRYDDDRCLLRPFAGLFWESYRREADRPFQEVERAFFYCLAPDQAMTGTN